MIERILTSGLVAMLLATSAFAAPQVVPLGSDSTVDADPVAACGALAASPDEEGWRDRGLADKQIFLNGAQAACEAALRASPKSDAAKTWLGRVAEHGDEARAARLMSEAELAVEDRNFELAAERLETLRLLGNRQIAALRLSLRVASALRRWDEVLKLARQLYKHKALSDEQVAPVISRAHVERMRELVGDVTLESSGTERISAGTVLAGSGDSSDSAG